MHITPRVTCSGTSSSGSILVPEDVALTAAQIEPLAIALRIVERAELRPGDRVLVMGAGVHRGSDEIATLPALLKDLTTRYSTWYTLLHFEHTVMMLSSGRLDPSAAVTHEIAREELDEYLLRLAEPNEMGKVLLRY